MREMREKAVDRIFSVTPTPTCTGACTQQQLCQWHIYPPSHPLTHPCSRSTKHRHHYPQARQYTPTTSSQNVCACTCIPTHKKPTEFSFFTFSSQQPCTEMCFVKLFFNARGSDYAYLYHHVAQMTHCKLVSCKLI